jgi:colanic acid biosynthesis glycosyl transferase WcaI
MAQAVRTLAANPALRQRLGAAGFAYALAHLDRDAVLQQFEADVAGLVSNV